MLESKKEYMKLWRERNKEEIRLKRQKYVEAIERLVKHLELYRDVYPSRKQIHWLNQH